VNLGQELLVRLVLVSFGRLIDRLDDYEEFIEAFLRCWPNWSSEFKNDGSKKISLNCFSCMSRVLCWNSPLMCLRRLMSRSQWSWGVD
jgi:hypothetical protein